MSIFSPADSLGSRAPGAIAGYLTEIGDLEGAEPFAQAQAAGQALGFGKSAYTHTGFILGFIEPRQSGAQGSEPIVGIGQVQGDRELIGNRIKITLDKFFVADYPGNGRHEVLCEFSGKNQVAGETEELKFALRFEVADNAAAAIQGAPIFLGVTVGADGISFEGRTVNISSNLDETILATLDSPAFRNGLALLQAAQPALKPFSSLAAAAVSSTLKRKKNTQVHNFNLGLDFAQNATSARLRLGSYVVIQSDDAAGWNWQDLAWNIDAQALQYRDNKRPITVNYMVFGVAAFSNPTVAA